MICSECGKEIEDGEDYLFVADNYLQAKYFDTTDDCIFCSTECLCRSLSVETIMKGEDDNGKR